MQDLTVQLQEGCLNIRVGAIIQKGEKVLVDWSDTGKHYYTVGGRIRFGEDSRAAIARELEEELGSFASRLTGGNLACVVENFFELGGIKAHELVFYYLYDGSALPEAEELCEGERAGKLKWFTVQQLKGEKMFPEFLQEYIPDGKQIIHIVKREW